MIGILLDTYDDKRFESEPKKYSVKSVYIFRLRFGSNLWPWVVGKQVMGILGFSKRFNNSCSKYCNHVFYVVCLLNVP